MKDFLKTFKDRLQEIDDYLDLLENLEKQVQQGPPRIGVGQNVLTITVTQIRIMYSSVYLQLYNLVEATIIGCMDGIASAITDNSKWKPGDLSDHLRREWVRFIARTHIELSHDNRLISALDLCDHLIQSLPISKFEVAKGGGGNWDDKTIEDLSNRLGITWSIDKTAISKVKRHFRNDEGSLEYIKSLRNDLAHGKVSFAESGSDITVGELRELKDRTAIFLEEVVKLFKAFIDKYEFLVLNQRPQTTKTK